MSGQKKSATDSKSGQDTAKSGQESPNRYHVDYWRERLFRKTYTWQGERREVQEWSVRFQHLGRREAFALGTANATAAASKAKEIATYLEANGWDATRAKFKPDTVVKVRTPTVGEYLVAARAVANIAPGTFETYASKLRHLVAGVAGIEPEKVDVPVINDKTGKPQRSRRTGNTRTRKIDPRFDYVHGGAQRWREKIEAVQLDKVTPERVQKWVTARLQSVAANPAKHAATKTTINSVLRACGSLFTVSIIRHLSHLTLPSPLPFDGVEKPAVARKRYESRVSAELLHARAEIELRDSKAEDAADRREMFAIYLLALFAGLRRDEIDTLTWAQIDFEGGRVHIETNEHTAAKSKNSEGSVTLAPDVLAYLKEKHAARSGVFVIESPVKPRPATTYHHYRVNRLFDKLIAWLRESAGVKARNPVHTLRKEFGSFIARKFGIFAASEALRHGDIRLTRDYYVTADNRATFGPSAFAAEGKESDKSG